MFSKELFRKFNTIKAVTLLSGASFSYCVLYNYASKLFRKIEHPLPMRAFNVAAQDCACWLSNQFFHNLGWM
jgi:hypothetical protein